MVMDNGDIDSLFRRLEAECSAAWPQRRITFSDGTYLEFDRGKIDDWCVYYNEPNKKRKPPRDKDYFAQLLGFAKTKGMGIVYSDFVVVFNLVGKAIDQKDVEKIRLLAETYPCPLDAEKLFCTLYMAMISEENRAGTHLGKRIKRLGVYKLLVERLEVEESATCMNKMGWREIDALCKERGF